MKSQTLDSEQIDTDARLDEIDTMLAMAERSDGSIDDLIRRLQDRRIGMAHRYRNTTDPDSDGFLVPMTPSGDDSDIPW